MNMENLRLNFTGKCDRCGCSTRTFTMSFFNTQHICKACEARERKHPLYENAVKAERDEIAKGNRNFEGIGLPRDLLCRG